MGESTIEQQLEEIKDPTVRDFARGIVDQAVRSYNEVLKERVRGKSQESFSTEEVLDMLEMG